MLQNALHSLYAAFAGILLCRQLNNRNCTRKLWIFHKIIKLFPCLVLHDLGKRFTFLLLILYKLCIPAANDTFILITVLTGRIPFYQSTLPVHL